MQGCKDVKPYEADLEKLDSAIEQNEYWIENKMARINFIKEKARKSQSAEELYWLNKDIYNEYKEYDADSASVYISNNMELARKLGKAEEQILWKIEEIGTLIRTGRLDEAEKEMNDIDVQSLSKYGKMQYFAQAMNLNLTYSYYIEDMGTPGPKRSVYFNKALELRDSTMQYITRDLPEYFNIRSWEAFDEDKEGEVKAELKAHIDACEFNSVEDGVGAYMLSQIYRKEGEHNSFVHYLVLSCLSYVRSGCRNYDSESLQDLSQLLLNEGDISRAFNYITYCANNLTSFKNRAHIVRIRKLQDNIAEAYLKRERSQSKTILITLIIAAILVWVLVWAVLLILEQIAELSKSKRELSEANAQLKENLKEKEELNARIGRRNKSLADLNSKLDEQNNKLSETNTVKEQYIGYVFSLCSEFITKLEDFRKTAYRQYRAGMRAELTEYLSSGVVMQDELRSFYQGFDKTFLELYPDFVSSLNALMQPGQEITQKDPQKLGTDLRILALMRLGILDCDKIAEFLHCSVQSVYNSRRGIYARLAISPKEFKERITSLSTCHFSTISAQDESE